MTYMKTCIPRSIVFLALFSLAATLYSQTPDDLNPGADNFVYATAIQPDGKILVARWTLPLTRESTLLTIIASCGVWPCRPMGRFSWGAISRRWGDSRAATLAGLIAAA